jgi:hypothetical protein
MDEATRQHLVKRILDRWPLEMNGQLYDLDRFLDEYGDQDRAPGNVDVMAEALRQHLGASIHGRTLFRWRDSSRKIEQGEQGNGTDNHDISD